MALCIGVVTVWAGCIVVGLAFQSRFKSNNTTIKVFNLADRAVKHKKYQSSINERTKGMSK